MYLQIKELKTMATICSVCENPDARVVWSGVDALMLGIPGAETGKYCYSCASLKPWEPKHDCSTDSSGIVWSGVDAFMYGIPGAQTGKYCHDCARAKSWEETTSPA